MIDDDDIDDGDYSYFMGPCTCGHDLQDHGWLACDIDGCDCEAHWEE